MTELEGLRAELKTTLRELGLVAAAAGTHPIATWQDVELSPGAHQQALHETMRELARREPTFALHVHVAVPDAETAVRALNRMRVHLPLLLALSANSPFWRAQNTGLLSVRTPIFRAFPRVGIPPTYRDFQEYSDRIGFMVESKAIADYTYLWYDVRPHPNFGTVEIRVCDQQTRIEHTLALAALVQALVRELCEHFDAGSELSSYPFEMLDENKWLAARHGLDGELVDLPSTSRVPTKELARRVIDRVRGHAEDLGSAAELDGIDDLLDGGNGASRQIVVYEANNDLREVVGEIVEKTSA
jgi:carboxylate-amine ligase